LGLREADSGFRVISAIRQLLIYILDTAFMNS
jgi:hypothetical protein